MLYEFYQLKENGCRLAKRRIVDLRSVEQAAPTADEHRRRRLADLSATVRAIELKRGIEHAMRVTRSSRRATLVHPATHYASKLTDADLPRMGERFRLQDFDIKGFSPEVQAILKGLQKCWHDERRQRNRLGDLGGA